ncbi:PilZ domain-containing protein [Dokdonella ginsengisoli]|uniref:PilZ domain-containing protein n=1 Tax=Dokdonella ginsengisoli TaxID=363846 RepID=A0ABV9QTV2_9GAMM
MPIRSAILMSRGGNAWSSEVENISATGVLARRPEGWSGQIGDRYVLDMLIGDTLDIHVEARLARITDDQLGFAYERIPEDREAMLWNLLGDYADRLEPYSAG